MTYNATKLRARHHPNRESSFSQPSIGISTPSQRPLQKRQVHLPELFAQPGQNTALRECCKIKEEVRYSISNENRIRKNRVQSRMRCLPWDNAEDLSSNHIKKGHSDSKGAKSLKKVKKNHSKQHLFIVPQLKQFDATDFNDSQAQTRHKVVNQERPKRMLTEGSYNPFAMPSVHERYGNYSEMQSATRSRNEEREKSAKVEQGLAKQKLAYDQKTRDQTNNDADRYYKYLQNYPKTKRQTQPQTPKKRQLNFEEQPRSAPSQLKTTSRKDSNTLFHQNKVKYSEPKMTKSNLSLTQFKVLPRTEEEISSFLLNYRPMDPKFDLRELVKSNCFEIAKKEGELYLGIMKDKQKQGKGVLITQNSIFEGRFAGDEKIYGSEKNQNGVYCGSFQHGKRHGKGTFEWTNGQSFEGEWKKGKKDGHGIWRSPKGNFYEGQWKDNKQNGKGIYIHVGGSKYTGYFKDFLKHGRGEEQFKNGDHYAGQYKEGKPHGYGKYCWKNGDRYEGQFVSGSREGKGILFKSDGSSYEGEFVNDLKDGKGKQKYANGQYFEGDFKEGDKVQGKLFNAKGQILQEIEE